MLPDIRTASDSTEDDGDFDRLLTVAEVAALLHVPPSWVYARTRHRGAQRIPFIKLGKYVRFEPAAVRAFLARQRKPA
jgi:excisionase family DNA binding protein